jgi:hypothetical protein
MTAISSRVSSRPLAAPAASLQRDYSRKLYRWFSSKTINSRHSMRVPRERGDFAVDGDLASFAAQIWVASVRRRIAVSRQFPAIEESRNPAVQHLMYQFYFRMGVGER